MLNVITSSPAFKLAKAIASRNEVTQSFATISAEVVTTSDDNSTHAVVSLVPENSEVSFVGFVAVDVTKWFRGMIVGKLTRKAALPLASVVTVAEPKKVCPSPKPLGSAARLS